MQMQKFTANEFYGHSPSGYIVRPQPQVGVDGYKPPEPKASENPGRSWIEATSSAALFPSPVTHHVVESTYHLELQ